jgi:hypothetical protein
MSARPVLQGKMKKGLIIMIAPGKTRGDRANRGPAGYKDSMRQRDGLDGSDGYGSDGAGDDSEDLSGSPEAVVPVKCLSDGDGAPQVGDTISFDCEGVVKSAQDGNVLVELKTVNGESCGYGDGGGDDGQDAGQDNTGGMGGNTQESTASMGSRLRKKASSII